MIPHLRKCGIIPSDGSLTSGHRRSACTPNPTPSAPRGGAMQMIPHLRKCGIIAADASVAHG